MPPLQVLWFAKENSLSVDSRHDLDNPDLEITGVTELSQAAAAVRTGTFECVLVSIDSAVDRAAVLETLFAEDTNIPVIFWHQGLAPREAIQLAREGAYNCHGDHDKWADVIASVKQACMERRARRASEDPNSEPWRRELVGTSPAMEDVANTIRLVGPFRCTVLITGGTGTGKEMAARALHNASPRASLPMVAVNCSAVPESLLEAELFGHVKGAFTGATNQRIGRFEQAHRSTIFLDEIGDMPLELQAKLLRVLQERELQRLGSSDTIKIDVRVIAASNANLPDLVRQGKFREDLYYRLNVVPLEMPPLRKRATDIPQLVNHFIGKVCHCEGIPPKQVTPKTVERLAALPWPGNVRQLENAVEKAIAMSGPRAILHAADFGLADSNRLVVAESSAAPAHLPEEMDFATAVSQFEKAILEGALAKTGGNKTAAAELLGLKRTTLIMKLRGMHGAGRPFTIAS